MKPVEHKQWYVQLSVWHGPQFGHKLEIEQWWRGRDAFSLDGVGSWRGVGIPTDVMIGALSRLDAVAQEHLLTRYGEAVSLLDRSGGEPQPF